MTTEQAIAVVEALRKELRIPKAMRVSTAEQAIVAYKPDPEAPGPPEDRLAWIVTLCSPLGFVHVDVDDTTAAVLDVQRSA
jgi:hypothetical protein